jgi:hypothetical protein
LNKARTRGTIEYFKVVSWNSMNRRTINGSNPDYKNINTINYLKKGIALDFSKKEYYDWCESQRDIIEKIYTESRTPSIDRVNPDKNYSLDNVRILPFDMNNRRFVPIYGFDKKNNIKIEFSSIAEYKNAGFDTGHLYKVLSGERKTHKGFFWSHKRFQ